MANYYASLIEGAQANIGQMTQKLGQASIISPMDGIVSDLLIDGTNLVSQQEPVAVIGSDECVEVYVSTRELDGIETGDSVELVLDKRMGDKVIKGTISLIEDKAQARQSALGVEERKVRVLIDPLQEGLTIGEDVDVKFTTYSQENSLVVPKTAVFQKDGKDMVWLVKSGLAYSAPIETGLETRDGYVVTSGLSFGDTIVIEANTEGLSEGKRVRQK